MEKRVFMVRAGRNGVWVDKFLDESIVAIGFGGGVAQFAATASSVTREDIIAMFKARETMLKEGTIITFAGQIYRFLNEMHEGDWVLTYDTSRRHYILGQLAGAAEAADDESEFELQRKVRWMKRILREQVSEDTKNGLGAIQTIFKVRERTINEIFEKAFDLDAPIPTAVVPSKATDGPITEEGSDLEAGFDDLQNRSNEFIEDLIAKLSHVELPELVAGILRAMGYRTQVAGGGADRGVDIFASPDGLGLEEPRIFVEVKHRQSTSMGAPQIRSFMGGRQPGDRCLYVSTGGFTKDAKYEADRSAIPLKLLALPELRELVVEYYDKLDDPTRSLVPLRRLYWPAR